MRAMNVALLAIALGGAVALGSVSGCSHSGYTYRAYDTYGDYYPYYGGYPEDTYYYYDREWCHPRMFYAGDVREGPCVRDNRVCDRCRQAREVRECCQESRKVKVKTKCYRCDKD